MLSYQVVLLAAGQGKRMQAGRNKQFLSIAGIPLLIHTLRVFEEDSLCKEVLLVVNKKEREEIDALLKEWKIQKKIRLVDGGRERQDSVYAGLMAGTAGNAKEDLVFIHDAARPFIRREELHFLAEETAKSGAAILAVPVKDTVKEVKEGTITKTTDRSLLWAAQTPQAFRYEVIVEAHEFANQQNHIGTDDASLVEHAGGTVKIVQGHYENFKVTTPEDLLFAEAVIRHRQGGRA
ncbi:2-C-methyl-D-erythritol 4-phosphate cytidylyltransferase [Alkalicoccus daliensis]|uniref:2-C-methyl-D-erythritol 4-phosphate cytidylyltransferase n=1 Tax=Alkalicoccus daliensis TaxID=745820 RepID=A0A1H0L5L8_9BACI|nr:2-C-methyl-D-erythritol 4-phosphate cytidylyltransferase [Alkalicoccus daliensis]SDO63250.1 2-C-methyl-D-erythritol 4-phosphate cytidylyltransferase [Alkalicoccus daliensis]